MGVLAQLNSQKLTFSDPTPLGTWLASKLAKAGQGSSVDPPVPTTAAATDGIYDVAQATQTSGNMTLTVTIRQADGSEEAFTTGNIAFNDTAATVEGAIDTAATSASVTGWTNGDITASGTAVNNADNIVLTFDGASVTGRPVAVTLADVDGAGGAWGAVTTTTRGQTERAALATLIAFNVIDGSSIPEQDAATSVTSVTGSANFDHNIPANVVKALMREAAAEDANNSTYHSAEVALWGQGRDRSPLVEERVPADNTEII